MISTRIEVKKTVLLEFELPGVNWTGAGGTSNERQLEQRFGENWQMKVNMENALATADVFAALAKAIRESMVG